MKLIIAGSRNLVLRPHVIDSLFEALELPYNIKELVTGCAEGIDRSGEDFVRNLNTLAGPEHKILIKKFPADWEKYGKPAGPIRNKEMAEYADCLLLIWTGDPKTSPGSNNMKQEMLKLKKPVYEVILRKL